MTIVASVAVLVTCIVLILIGLYMAAVAARLGRLSDYIRTRIDDSVLPWLAESRKAIAEFDQASKRASQTFESLGRAASLVEGGIEGVNPLTLGRKLAFQAAKAATIWLAGLRRAAEAVREQKSEAPRTEETDSGPPRE